MSKWIANAVKNHGALHRALGVPEGEKIPEDKLEAAANSRNPKIRREAALAKTLKGFHKKKKPHMGMSSLYGKVHSKG
jgi:hypothetical protein